MCNCFGELDTEIAANEVALELLQAAMTKVMHDRTSIIARETLSKVVRAILQQDNPNDAGKV